MIVNRMRTCLLVGWLTVATVVSTGAANWPGWRGDGGGVSPEKDLPLKWSEAEGVKWKTPITGAGHSSPIVWGNRVFVTTAVAEDPNVETFRGGVYMGGDRKKPDESAYAYTVICLDADRGNVLWSKAIARQRPKTRRHTKNTYASETPVTDGTHVFASFGSAGLYCLDYEGKVIWHRDLGLLRGRQGWGTGASPILFQGTVIVTGDSSDESYIAAFEKTTGDPVWRTERKEGPSWGTPFLFDHNGRAIVVTNATRRMRGYEAATGKLLWECAGGSMISVPSPVAAQGLVFLSSGHNLLRRQPIIAVHAEASGDITPTKNQLQTEGIAWRHPRGGAYVTSPVAVDRYLYVPLDRGTLTCYEAQTGQVVYEKQDLGTRNTITASPVAADGRIYLLTDEIFCASPAVSGNRLFLRGRKHLYCIGQ